MDPAMSLSKDDEIGDLKREVARLKRLNDNLTARLEHDAVRLENEVVAYEATTSELREALNSSRQQRVISDSRLEDALRAAREHQESRERAEATLAIVEKEKAEISAGTKEGSPKELTKAMEEAERRFRVELATAFGQREEEKKVTARVERLLQNAIDRTKMEEDKRIRAEGSLARVEAERASFQNALIRAEQDATAMKERLATLEVNFAQTTHEKARLETRVADLQTERTLLQQQAEIPTVSLEAMTTELNKVERTCQETSKARERLETRTKERDELQKRVWELQRELVKFSTDLKDKKQELANVKDELKNVLAARGKPDRVQSPSTIALSINDDNARGRSITVPPRASDSLGTQLPAQSGNKASDTINVHLVQANQAVAGSDAVASVQIQDVSHITRGDSIGSRDSVEQPVRDESHKTHSLPTMQSRKGTTQSRRKRPAVDPPDPSETAEAKRRRIETESERRQLTSENIMALKACVPFRRGDVQLSSALPVGEWVPEEKLPSSAHAFTGYVSTQILNKHYHLRASWETLLMICPATCQGRVPRCVPLPTTNEDVEVLHTPEAVFGALDMQPGFPIIPGQPGTMLVLYPPSSDPATASLEPNFALFVTPPTTDENQEQWLYLGQYAYVLGLHPLSARAWRDLPQQVRDKWIETLHALCGRILSRARGGIHRLCIMVLVRIALRKRNLPAEHAEDVCDALMRCSHKTIPALDISKDDIKHALDNGDERLSVVRLVPKSFNKEWYLELQDLASGELTVNPRCDELFAEPRAPWDRCKLAARASSGGKAPRRGYRLIQDRLTFRQLYRRALKC